MMYYQIQMMRLKKSILEPRQNKPVMQLLTGLMMVTKNSTSVSSRMLFMLKVVMYHSLTQLSHQKILPIGVHNYHQIEWLEHSKIGNCLEDQVKFKHPKHQVCSKQMVLMLIQTESNKDILEIVGFWLQQLLLLSILKELRQSLKTKSIPQKVFLLSKYLLLDKRDR